MVWIISGNLGAELRVARESDLLDCPGILRYFEVCEEAMDYTLPRRGTTSTPPTWFLGAPLRVMESERRQVKLIASAGAT